MDPAQVAAYAAHFQPQSQPQPQPQPQQQQSFTAVNTVPSHPSYPEMITAAIVWENNQGKVSGSSKRAIEKYIDRVYTDLPPTHSALLSHNLQKLKNSGQLVMLKNSYQLPCFLITTTTVDAATNSSPVTISTSPQLQPSNYSDTPQRKRGRPPKPYFESQPQPQPQAQFESQPQPQAQEVVGNGGSSTGKRPRGRPPKAQAQEVVVPFVQPISEVVSNGNVNVNDNGNGNGNGNGDVAVASLSGKRRGRPPKKQEAQETGFQVDLGTLVEERKEVSLSGKRRGRPPKKQEEVLQQVGFQVELVDGGVNSPVYEEMPMQMPMPVSLVKKTEVKGVGVGRGGPKMNVGSNVVTEMVGGEKKKRGWPKGKLRGKRGFLGFGVAKYGGKKRGRKPKSGLEVVGKVEKKAYSGKPRGRKKNSATSGQGQETVNDELQRKLEDMQSKLKDAVRLIKPHLAYQTPPDALAALQQLEDLSTMSLLTQAPALMAPPVNDVPMDVTAPPQNTSAPNLTAPTMTAFTASTEMNVPLPYSMNAPSMTVTSPFQAPIIGNEQPLSWIPSNGAQL